jgi:predicted acylesterase/phospholipase RssA
MSDKNCILVCSIGGLKAGACAVGTFFALKSSGYNVVGLAGSSGGSIFLPMLASGASIIEIIDLVTQIEEDSLYDQDFLQQTIDSIRKRIPLLGKRKGDLPFTGIMRGNSLRFELNKMYKAVGCEDLSSCKIPTMIVSTQITASREAVKLIEKDPAMSFIYAINNSKTHAFMAGSSADAVRASCSIPLVFRPVLLNGNYYVDGGATSSMPVWPAVQKFGAYDVFISDATGDVFEEPLYTEDIDSIVAVITSTIHTIVRSNTLDQIKMASDFLATHNKKIERIFHKTKLKMFDTENFKDAVYSAFVEAKEWIRKHDENRNR